MIKERCRLRPILRIGKHVWQSLTFHSLLCFLLISENLWVEAWCFFTNHWKPLSWRIMQTVANTTNRVYAIVYQLYEELCAPINSFNFESTVLNCSPTSRRLLWISSSSSLSHPLKPTSRAAAIASVNAFLCNKPCAHVDSTLTAEAFRLRTVYTFVSFNQNISGNNITIRCPVYVRLSVPLACSFCYVPTAVSVAKHCTRLLRQWQAERKRSWTAISCTQSVVAATFLPASWTQQTNRFPTAQTFPWPAHSRSSRLLRHRPQHLLRRFLCCPGVRSGRRRCLSGWRCTTTSVSISCRCFHCIHKKTNPSINTFFSIPWL